MIAFATEDYSSPTLSISGGTISIEVTIKNLGLEPTDDVYVSDLGKLNVYTLKDTIYFSSPRVSFSLAREEYIHEYTKAVLKNCLQRASNETMDAIRHLIVSGKREFIVGKMSFTNVARNVYHVAVGDCELNMTALHFRDPGIGTPRSYYSSDGRRVDVPPLIADRINNTANGKTEGFNTYTAYYSYCCGTRIPRTIHITDRHTGKCVELLYSDWCLQTLSL